MLIKIDGREKKLIETMAASYPTVKIKQCQLNLGDIIIEDDDENIVIIIERKSVSDLASSIGDGRYSEQSFRLNGCAIHNHNIVYLIEGDIRHVKEYGHITKNTLYSALVSLNVFKGFSVLRTFDIGETAIQIVKMAEKLEKESKKGNHIFFSNAPTSFAPTSFAPSNAPTSFAPSTASEVQGTTYVDVIKQNKKDNITPENIGEIMLCQIPNVSKLIAKTVMVKHKTINTLLELMKLKQDDLDNLKTSSNGKERKISKTAIANIRTYLLN